MSNHGHIIMPAKKSSKGNTSPILLTLGSGIDVSIGGPDIPFVTDFAGSLTGGQVKTKLQKMLARKVLSHDDTVQVAEVIASEYVEFVRTFPKYDSMPNKKTVIIRAKAIAGMAQELIKDDSEDEGEGGEDVASGAEEMDETDLDVDLTVDAKSDAGEEDDVEDTEENEKEGGDTDEELEARAVATGFIPVSKPARAGNSGKIVTKTTLLTATYRTKEGREHNPTAVVGVGPGKLRFETELNEDGSLKKGWKTSKTQSASDATMYFYTGSLSEENSSDVPLKTGIRLTDSSHLQRMCTEIVVRAFSQQVFTHKSLKIKSKRNAVKANIIKWLAKEVDEGVNEVLNQLYDEAKDVLSNEKQESREVKRKLDGKQALLAQASKKTKKVV